MKEAEFESYFDFLGRLGDTLEELTELARQKSLAVRNDDLMGVNDCMKQEQVISLSLRGMEAKREKMLAELGLSGVPLSGLEASCPESLRPRAKEAARSLRSKFEIYNSAADVARTMLECNLHEIERMMAETSADPVPPKRSLADIRA